MAHIQSAQGDGTKLAKLNEAMHAAAKQCLMEVRKDQPGWFQARQPELMGLIEARNAVTELLARASKARDQSAIDVARATLRGARSLCKAGVTKAKAEWIEERIRALRGGEASPTEVYKVVKELAAGMGQSKPVLASLFRKVDGSMSSIEENAKTVQEHFTRVYDAPSTIDLADLEEIQQRPVREDLATVPTDEEIVAAIRKAKSNRSPGDSKIPPEFWKALVSREDTFALVHEIVHDIWLQRRCPEEFLVGRLKILPKKGDLHDLNNWRGIMLLESLAKVVSIILDIRLQSVVATEGHEDQNGFRPERGTRDGIFSLKMALQKRKEHGLSSWVVFIDLVKAFDTVPRDALFTVLKKYGLPDVFVNVVKSLYENFTVKLSVGEAGDVQVPSTIGVLQGSNLSPTLFIVFMQAVMEVTQRKMKCVKPVFSTKKDGVIFGRRFDTGGPTRSKVTEFHMGESFYADDGAFLFESRDDAEETLNIMYPEFKRFGMQIHIGRNGVRSKTEALFVPHSRSSYAAGDTSDMIVADGFVGFTKMFKYLGSSVSSSLNDDGEVDLRIKAAGALFGKWRKAVFQHRNIPFSCKKLAYEGIILATLLYGCEAWAITAKSLDKLQKFHRKSTRQMCRVTTEHMWKHQIDTETLEDRVGLRSLECYLSKRRLQWAGAVMRMDWEVRLPRKLITSWVYHQRPNGGPVMHFGRNLKRDLLRIELSLDPPPVVFPDAVRVSDRQRNKSRNQVHRFGNIAPRSKVREAKRLLTPMVESPPAQYWVELTENKCTWEKYVEDTLTIARLATLIQKRSGGLTSRGQALLEAREQILAKSMRAGAEAADRSLRQERAALEILTCAWDDCNERATMRCPWCHQVPYCRLEHRDLNFDLHGVECRARAMYR
jgi:hypothetical protein